MIQCPFHLTFHLVGSNSIVALLFAVVDIASGVKIFNWPRFERLQTNRSAPMQEQCVDSSADRLAQNLQDSKSQG